MSEIAEADLQSRSQHPAHKTSSPNARIQLTKEWKLRLFNSKGHNRTYPQRTNPRFRYPLKKLSKLKKWNTKLTTKSRLKKESEELYLLILKL